MWGPRVAALARRYPIDELVPEVVADIIGVPATVLRGVDAQCRTPLVGPDDAIARAARPMALLHAAVAQVVRDRAAARPDTVLDELLFWRGLGQEGVPLDAVAALVTALTAAMWDAASMLLPHLLDASVANPGADRTSLVDTALRGGPGVIGWLRVTTQSVLLDGELLPAGEHCLLLVDAEEPTGRRAREPLRTMRWLSPDAPSGAGAAFARLVGDALPALLGELPADLRCDLPDISVMRDLVLGAPRRHRTFHPVEPVPAATPRARSGFRR
jgi:hypothetical protein